MTTTTGYRMPERDLCADLAVDTDPELGDSVNVCRASNRHMRLYVAAWMLFDDVHAAHALYTCSGDPGLLDKPGRLTTSAIAAEVARLKADPAEQWDR